MEHNQKVNIFIDTNVLLTFFHFSSDDLEELRKLIAVISVPENKLFYTSQVLDEFNRNRENKIADALKKFKEEKLENQFPHICKEYAEYEEMRAAIKIFKEKKAKIQEQLMEDVKNNTLKADEIIDGLLGKAEEIRITPRLMESARLRMDLRNPPGKKGSLGDAINWEALLSVVPNGQDLSLISEDGDYSSALSDPMNESVFNKYLEKEWVSKKNSKINFYTRLSDFLRINFPDIKISSEEEKKIAITGFVNSGTFAKTHNSVSRLSSVEHFTLAEVGNIADAIINNSQITQILCDEDIKEFVLKFLNEYKNKLEPDVRNEFTELLCHYYEIEEWELDPDLIPF